MKHSQLFVMNQFVGRKTELKVYRVSWLQTLPILMEVKTVKGRKGRELEDNKQTLFSFFCCQT